MMSSRIPLLEKFGVSFIVMSYFGHTHQSFLVLSQLSRRSRIMLDTYYEEFLNSMIGNNANFEKRINEELAHLPGDLFRYSIILFTESCLQSFIDMIEKINDKSGYYFNENYMNNRLLVEKLLIDSDLVEILHVNLELLKKTKAIRYILDDRNKILTENTSLVELIYLDIPLVIKNPSLYFIDRYTEKLEPNSSFEPFRKIDSLNVLNMKTEDATNYLSSVRDFGISINKLHLSYRSSEEGETLTNPEYYKKEVNSIVLNVLQPCDLNDTVLRNINKIKPNKLHLLNL